MKFFGIGRSRTTAVKTLPVPLRRRTNGEATAETSCEPTGDADIGVAARQVENTDEVVTAMDGLGEVLAFKSEVVDGVKRNGKGQCLALDLGFNCVALVALPAFAATGHYNTIRQTLLSRSLIITHERLVTPELMLGLAAEVEHLSQQRRAPTRNVDELRNQTLFSELIAGSHRLGATDVHFVYRGDQLPSDVRLRIYGRMSDWKTLPGEHIRSALAAGYTSLSVAGTNSEPDWSPNKPCSTITRHEIAAGTGRRRGVSGRFTSRPSVGGGCKVTIRLLDTDIRNMRIPSLVQLGYAESHIEDQLEPALRKNQGCVLIAGGTGSGKSTTLRTFMDSLPEKESLERYSVEDPVEYVLPGVIQLSIQRSSDASAEVSALQFTSALRDLTRMDPDVAMIGEIRDEETARLATEMVNTGHRVLSTVHGNGAIDVLDRLTGKTLAVSPSTLSSGSFLVAVMYQKLMPLLCSYCKLPAEDRLSAQQQLGIARFGLTASTMFVANREGCAECRLEAIAPTGTRGLTVAAEVVTPDAKLLACIRAQDWPAARSLWRASRRSGYGDSDMTGKTAFEHALYKMSRGIVDINDIERDFELLVTYEIQELGDAA